jgi:hypothetical protein
MVLALALGILCIVGVIGALVAVAVAVIRDSRSPIPTVWDYDTRRPLP